MKDQAEVKEGGTCKRLPTEAKRSRRLKYGSKKEKSKSVETGKMRTKKDLLH